MYAVLIITENIALGNWLLLILFTYCGFDIFTIKA